MINGIGTFNEQPLHSALKDAYTDRGGRQEVAIGGYVIDVVNGEQLIEIQTQRFYAIKRKIFELINKYSLKLVYPIASEKWLLKLPKVEGGDFERRKSPKRGQPYEVFNELVSFPELLKQPNFIIDVALVDVEEVRRYTGKQFRRQNGWKTLEQRLIRIRRVITVQRPADLLDLIPERLPVEFTTADLEKAAQMPRWLAQKAAYCMKQAGAVRQIGKRGRFNLYKQIT